MIVGVTGMRGSGKSLFADVARKMDVPVVEMRDAVVSMMKEKRIEINSHTLREFPDDLRKEQGEDVVARLTFERFPCDGAVVIGVRSKSEIEFFKSKGNFVLIAVTAPQKLRWERIKARKNKDDPRTPEEFEWADRVEQGWGLGEAIGLADYLLVNDKEKAETEKSIEELLESLLIV